MARAVSPPFEPCQPSTGRGRGARSNRSGRFEAQTREGIDDGWEQEPPRKVATDILFERSRRIVTYNDSPYVGFDRSINPYRGCEHGCIYCFARPSHAYLGLSPGIDFETKLYAKPNAAELLARELSAKRYEVRPIAIGTNTDPYQPIERKLHVMREVLKVLSDFGHPVSILTKSDLVLRDLDIIGPMAAKGLARAMLSITTLDPKLARSMEPRASRPANRLKAVRQLAEAGVPTGVVHGPVIPGLTDHEIESLMSEAKEAGATYAAYTILRLPQEIGPLMEEWLQTFAPNRAARVIGHLKEMNGGKIYDVRWSREKDGPKSQMALLIAQRFRRAYRQLGFQEMPSLRSDLFAVPRAPDAQGDLFG